MQAIIMFGHGKYGEVAEDCDVMNLGRQVIYRNGGIFRHPGKVFSHSDGGDPSCLNFIPYFHDLAQAMIVFNGEMPTEDQIDKAIMEARVSHPWKFTNH